MCIYNYGKFGGQDERIRTGHKVVHYMQLNVKFAALFVNTPFKVSPLLLSSMNETKGERGEAQGEFGEGEPLARNKAENWYNKTLFSDCFTSALF